MQIRKIMYQVKKISVGTKYIELDLNDMVSKLNGYGICDSCATPKQMNRGFLIPVLSSVYCSECFDEWKFRAEFYEEDMIFENEKTEHYLNQLNS